MADLPAAGTSSVLDPSAALRHESPGLGHKVRLCNAFRQDKKNSSLEPLWSRVLVKAMAGRPEGLERSLHGEVMRAGATLYQG